jgi:hypothetical protein
VNVARVLVTLLGLWFPSHRTAPPHHTHHAYTRPAPPTTWPALVTATVRAEWQRAAICETGGNWTMHGPVYSGGLGISNVNWRAYSVGLGFPATAGTATPTEQIVVAERVQPAPPDQTGTCAAW